MLVMSIDIDLFLQRGIPMLMGQGSRCAIACAYVDDPSRLRWLLRGFLDVLSWLLRTGGHVIRTRPKIHVRALAHLHAPDTGLIGVSGYRLIFIFAYVPFRRFIFFEAIGVAVARREAFVVSIVVLSQRLLC